MAIRRNTLVLATGFSLSACAYHTMNEAREVEVRQIVDVVECELFAAAPHIFAAELDPNIRDK